MIGHQAPTSLPFDELPAYHLVGPVPTSHCGSCRGLHPLSRLEAWSPAAGVVALRCPMCRLAAIQPVVKLIEEPDGAVRLAEAWRNDEVTQSALRRWLTRGRHK
jgi:hypothetical protein